jgi:hypothetical protein
MASLRGVEVSIPKGEAWVGDGVPRGNISSEMSLLDLDMATIYLCMEYTGR